MRVSITSVVEFFFAISLVISQSSEANEPLAAISVRMTDRKTSDTSETFDSFEAHFN